MNALVSLVLISLSISVPFLLLLALGLRGLRKRVEKRVVLKVGVWIFVVFTMALLVSSFFVHEPMSRAFVIVPIVQIPIIVKIVGRYRVAYHK